MARKRRKPLFAGLSVDLPTGPEMYADHFHAQRAADSARPLLKTPPTPPNRRPLPGGRAEDQARAADVSTRSRKGVVASVGTPNVPAGLRKSAGERVRPKSTDGRRKGRAASASRDKSAEKIVYSGRVGMTARKSLTREDVETARIERALIGLVNSMGQEVRAVVAEKSARADAQRNLSAAIGRERDALSRGDVKAAQSARADIRKFRKLAKFQGE